ncbi:unnamed protein product, partial [Mesorhabditis belari]|uniref:FANCI helical domain-containing protein n=1 Tax=Mesorhabditis belari TaxID=2138241 RepID=A0AAF3FMJ9_9BILA
MLHSEFGFGAMIQLCAIERYKSEAIQSLKRALSRVFKFDEASQKIGWLKLAIGASIADEAKLQMKNLSTRMNDRENWTLLSPGAISLCYSLFDTAQNQKVLVCDGRAASVPDLWTLASTLLSEAIGRSGNNLSTLLLPLVSTIAIHSNSINVSAAIVLIDVLVEVVHNCTIEVLNNYKQIEGIFDWVCRMRRDIAVSLIRTLLPIINQRSQLRQSLFAALKRDLLNSTSVASAVPLLLSLLQSISNRRNVTLSQGGMSQSFATFSSQSLAKMGLTRGVDEALGLEIVGVLKRCLAQPAQTRAALYSGITEVVHRNIQISGPCLELLLSHANTLPQWSTKEMILTSRTMTTVREAFPQLIQAIESLTCASISSIQAGFTQSHSGGDLLVQKAESLLLKWVNIAIERDIHEMELDKLTEWTPTTQEGRGNLLFAHQMLAVYDALLEFLWRRINSDIDSSEMELDRLIGIIRQRKELLEVLNEKTIRQKQEKAVNGNGVQTGNGDSKLMPLNLQEVDIYVSGRTISQLLDRLLKMDENDKLWEIKGELLNWTIKSSLKWSEELRKGELPLHSNVLRHSHLVNVAKHFLEIYIGDEVDSPAWTQEIPMISKTKTEALEVYSNIVRYSLLKYQRKILEYVVLMWKDDRTGGGEAGALSRHGVFLLNRLYFGLVIEDENAETPKKREIESEKQAKIITKLVNSLLLAANRSSTRASHIFVKTYWDILEQNEFASIQVLRDSLNAFADTSLQVQANAAITSIYKRILTIADALYSRYMGEEPSDEDPKCVSKEFGSAFIEFLILILEKSMLAIKEVVFHMSEFVEKDQWDEIFTHIVTRLVTCTEILQKMMQIHTDVGVAKEKISTTLTMFYDGFEISIKLLLDNAKVLKNDMGKWKSIESLSRLLKGELHTLLVHCDENVGEIEQEKKSKSATKITKIRREENLYVKYTRARESLQATILRLSVALNDDRLDLQVKVEFSRTILSYT